MNVLISYGWQKSDMGYVEVLILCIKMGWRVKTLPSPYQHIDTWKANSVSVLEKIITRVEANKISQQDCALSFNTENTLLCQIKWYVNEASLSQERDSSFRTWLKTNSVKSVIYANSLCILSIETQRCIWSCQTVKILSERYFSLILNLKA